MRHVNCGLRFNRIAYRCGLRLRMVISMICLLATSAIMGAETLQTLEVVGSRVYRTGSILNEEISESHSRIGRDTLERSPDALADILARETGVQQRQSGGFGSFASVSIRAASGAQTGVYLDGILLNTGGNPVVDFSTLELLNLASVDIYRGSSPLQLGHGSIGGAVNLTTLPAGTEPATRARVGIGSLSHRELQLSHQSTHGSWDLVGAVSRRQSDNDFRYTNDNGTPLNTADDQVEQRANAAAQRTAALLKLGYRFSEDARTDLTLQVAAHDTGVPAFHNRPDNEASYTTDSSQLQLSHEWNALGAWNSRHDLYWHSDAERFQDRLARIGLAAQDTDHDTRTLGVKSYWEYLGQSATTGLSLELRRETLDATDRVDTSTDFDVQRDSVLGTVHHAWFDTSGTWSVTPALRWQASSVSGSQTRFTTTPDQDSNDNAGLQIGIAYRPSARLRLTANAGNHYREPSFGELYGAIGLINGNPLLKPEKGINLDAGVKYTTQRTSIEATLFASDRDELIVTSFDARGVGRPVNTGAARVTGIELSGSFAPTPSLQLRSNLTWQSPVNRDDARGFNGRFLPGEARLAWFTRIQHQRSRLTYWYEMDVQEKRFYDRANILPATDTRQHAIGLDYRDRDWLATLGIRNLSDDTVEDFNGFPKPGRTWSLSITRSL